MIGKKIYEARKVKGLSQEELSDLSKINIRTLQRIENDQNVPRGKTLNLLCEVLQLDISEFHNKTQKKDRLGHFIIEIAFLGLLNLVLMSIFGYLTLDSEANINSRVAAILLSLFLPYFIVSKTLNLSGFHRLAKYGTGLILYLIFIAFKIQFPDDLLLGFYPAIILAICILYYGTSIAKSE